MIKKGLCGSQTMSRAERKQGSKEIHLIFVSWFWEGWEAVHQRHVASWQGGLQARRGVTMITDGRGPGKRMPESPRRCMLFWGLHTNHDFFHSVPVLTQTHGSVDWQLNSCRLLKSPPWRHHYGFSKIMLDNSLWLPFLKWTFTVFKFCDIKWMALSLYK